MRVVSAFLAVVIATKDVAYECCIYSGTVSQGLRSRLRTSGQGPPR